MKIFTRLIKRIFLFLCAVWLLSVLVFGLSRLSPMNPLQSYYGERAEKMTEEQKVNARKYLGLDESICVQYIRWAENAVRGDFGISYKYKQPVTEVISVRAANTIVLGGTGFVITFALALAVGILCAYDNGRIIDRTICKVGVITSCIPEFWLSLVLMFVFSVVWHVLPSGGAYSIGKEYDIVDRIKHLILPVLTLVISHLWYYAYMIRNMLVEEQKKEYVLLCRVKGLSEIRILLRHCLKNIMPSYISMMAVSVPHILAGTYVIEVVFCYPGIGTLSYESALYADYNMLMVICLITGIVIMLFNLVAQQINTYISPRYKREAHKSTMVN